MWFWIATIAGELVCVVGYVYAVSSGLEKKIKKDSAKRLAEMEAEDRRHATRCAAEFMAHAERITGEKFD